MQIRSALGFTLVELLVVVSIIGILSALSFASFTSAQQRGRDGQRKFDLRSLQSALEEYYSQNKPQSYPTTLDELKTSGFVKTMPTDPVTSSEYAFQAYPQTPTTCSDASTTTVPCTSYELCAQLENSNDSDIAKSPCTLSGKTTWYGVSSQ